MKRRFQMHYEEMGVDVQLALHQMNIKEHASNSHKYRKKVSKTS